MVVRTRADSVEPVAKRVLAEFPGPAELAEAPLERIEDLLRPLGLFRKRARAISALARTLVASHQGTTPRQYDQLVALPYVGRYVANAVLCFAFGQRRAIVDANVARLFERVFDFPRHVGKLELAHLYWELAEMLLPVRNVRLYNWSLLDLGGTICTPRTPLRGACPLVSRCVAASLELTANKPRGCGPDRSERGGIQGGQI